MGEIDPQFDATDAQAPQQDGAAEPEQSEETTAEVTRRRAGRLSQELLQSDLGPIINLSVGGMRILCHKVPKGEVVVRIFGGDEPLILGARVAWSKRVGLFKHEVGLQFVDVDDYTARLLTTLATTGRLRRCI